MNHFMLPEPGETGARLSRGKYGIFAIPRLMEMAKHSGSKIGDLRASVIGGGSVTGHLGSLEGTALYNISDRNVEAAEKMLAELGMQVARRDTGGSVARKIHMDTFTGQIEVVQIQRSRANLERAEKIEELKNRKIGVLIVDDSATVRKILRIAVESSPDMEVVGEAANPYEAREKILQENPDVISLDIIMPRMDGITFLKKLMKYKYIPTVVVSTVAKEGSSMRWRAMEAGAVSAIDKNILSIYEGNQGLNSEYLPKLRAAARSVRTA